MDDELAKAYINRIIKMYELEDTPLVYTRTPTVRAWLFRYKQGTKMCFINADDKGGGVSGGLYERDWATSSDGKCQFVYGYAPADATTIILNSTKPVHDVNIARGKSTFLIIMPKTAVTITFKDSQDNTLREIDFKGRRKDNLLRKLSYWIGKPLYALKILRPPQTEDGDIYLHRKRDLIRAWFKKKP